MNELTKESRSAAPWIWDQASDPLHGGAAWRLVAVLVGRFWAHGAEVARMLHENDQPAQTRRFAPSQSRLQGWAILGSNQ